MKSTGKKLCLTKISLTGKTNMAANSECVCDANSDNKESLSSPSQSDTNLPEVVPLPESNELWPRLLVSKLYTRARKLPKGRMIMLRFG